MKDFREVWKALSTERKQRLEAEYQEIKDQYMTYQELYQADTSSPEGRGGRQTVIHQRGKATPNPY